MRPVFKQRTVFHAMTNKNEIMSYFEENAETWLLDGYEQSGYNYPTAFHRLRVVRSILPELENVGKVIDIGCGGGQLAFAMAEEGCQVIGYDQSPKMLELAKSQLRKQDAKIRGLVSFEPGSIDDFGEAECDALTAMGLIGYLPNDDVFFSAASKVLRKNGYAIVSFRNRLFNLYSISSRTLKEIETGQFALLAQEASLLYKKIGTSHIRSFLEHLHRVTGFLLSDEFSLALSEKSPSSKNYKTYSAQYEARQTTPQQASDTANKFGFDTLFMRGVHPHFLVPGLNEQLSPQLYNRLSDCLIPFESTSDSLLWSSVFIGVFRKRN